MKNRLRLLLIVSAAFVVAGTFLSGSSAQKRRDNFSHNTAAHKKTDCSSCHKNPTGNWVAARGYPDVADFPGHVACFACHRSDFFAGNKPAICAGCHVNPGPRGSARFPFPVRSRSHEFSTIFPHNIHQDIIASKSRKPDFAVVHFITAGFKAADDTPQFNNCAICHQTPKELPKVNARTPASMQPLAEAAAETFAPAAAFFMDAPNSHASCFSCHFQGLRPSGTNCASCHHLEAPHAESSVLQRYSLKFNHQDKDHVNKDCTVCHVRITQNADVRGMKDADVPILTCSTSSCHGSNITTEIGKREASIAQKQPAFQCTYCHSPAIGRFPIPPSHQNR